MILHAADRAGQGYKNILIRTVDSDVVVLAISFANRIECENLTVSFGIGKSFRNLGCIQHGVSVRQPYRKSHVLPFFLALTGCYTLSSFTGRGKRTVGQVHCFSCTAQTRPGTSRSRHLHLCLSYDISQADINYTAQ